MYGAYPYNATVMNLFSCLRLAADVGLLEEKEAMWMAFDCHESVKFAIRPFLGGVNGISGKTILPGEDAQPDEAAIPKQQDYITVPEQKRLDGIAVSPGLVKQFVATQMMSVQRPQRKDPSMSELSAGPKNIDAKDITELATKGQTIEWQMTGKDEIGGIQLQIIPQFELEHMFAGSMKDVCRWRREEPLISYQPVPANVVEYDVLKSPKELGLHEGDVIHVRNLRRERHHYGRARSKRVRDLLVEAPDASNSDNLVELEVFRPVDKILIVRIPNSGEDSVSFKVSASKLLQYSNT
jgi:hypothetical protein